MFQDVSIPCEFGDSTPSHFSEHITGTKCEIHKIFQQLKLALPWYLDNDTQTTIPINFTYGPGLKQLNAVELRIKSHLQLDFWTTDNIYNLKFKDDIHKVFYIPYDFLTYQTISFTCSCGASFRNTGFILHFMVNYCLHLLTEHMENKKLIEKVKDNLREIHRHVEGARELAIPNMLIDLLPAKQFSALFYQARLLYLCLDCYYPSYSVRAFSAHCAKSHGILPVTGISCIDHKRIGEDEASKAQLTAQKLLIIKKEAMFAWTCFHCNYLAEGFSKIEIVVDLMKHLFLSECPGAVDWRESRKSVFHDLSMIRTTVLDKATEFDGVMHSDFLRQVNVLNTRILKRYFVSDSRNGIEDLIDFDWDSLVICPFCMHVAWKVKEHFENCENIHAEVTVIEEEPLKTRLRSALDKRISKEDMERTSLLAERSPSPGFMRQDSDVESDNGAYEYLQSLSINTRTGKDKKKRTISSASTSNHRKVMKPKRVRLETDKGGRVEETNGENSDKILWMERLPVVVERKRHKCKICKRYIYGMNCSASKSFMVLIHFIGHHVKLLDSIPPSPEITECQFPPLDVISSLENKVLVCGVCNYKCKSFTEFESHAIQLHNTLKPINYRIEGMR